MTDIKTGKSTVMEAPNLYFISFDDNGLARHV